MTNEHWMASADLIYWDEQDQWLIGEDQHGDLWVPFVPTDMRPLLGSVQPMEPAALALLLVIAPTQQGCFP